MNQASGADELHIDQLGRIKVKFHWQANNRPVRAVDNPSLYIAKLPVDEVKRPGFRGGSNAGEWSHEEVRKVFA